MRLRAIPGVSGYSLAAASSTSDANRLPAARTTGPFFFEPRRFKRMAGRPETVADLRVASEYAVAEAACLNTQMLVAQRAVIMERPHDRKVVFGQIDRGRHLGPLNYSAWRNDSITG